MQAKREFRDRPDAEVAVLDALVNRHEEGMTVFELRSSVDVSIDRIEEALGNLKESGLIRVEDEGSGTRIYPDDRVIPEGDESRDPSLAEAIRERLPF